MRAKRMRARAGTIAIHRTLKTAQNATFLARETFAFVFGVGMGALCSCCTTGMTGDEEDGLLGDANSARSDEARRKAAEAALRRAGALAQRARPPPRSSSSNTRPSSISNNMRWEGG